MPSKTNTPAPPPLGTFIDNDGLELVEVLGVGGYGVVYRAVETRSCQPKSYAVKCLIQSQPHQSSRQRQLHIREITLHQLASAHPGVATLHRVIEEYNNTYIIMEYASDGDLFGQILNSCRYLGNDTLIKHVFLQLLDAVEYCHNLGIYHRDLKPENVLCFDGGFRIAITDFGLATTDRFSEEFRTGSVYHMSPECQGGAFAPTGTYSPLFNDIWSLAIILLNLATGRNPWKSASASDPTFQAYLQDPLEFLPTVLPISAEANAVLTHMLEVDWRHRMTLAEVRTAIEGIDSFYSDGVVFDGSMARCPWEVGVDIESESDSSTKGEPEELPEQQESRSDLQSYWSTDSDSEMKFASPSAATAESGWMDYSTCGASWGLENSERSCSPSPPPEGTFAIYDAPRTPPSTYSPLSARSSLPATPEGLDIPMEYRSDGRSKPLRVDTKCVRRRFFEGNFSANESGMQTAVESEIYDPFAASSFFLASPPPASAISMAMPSTVDLGSPSTMEAKEMGSISSWDYSADDDDESSSSRPSMSTSRADSILDIDEEFDVEDMIISPDMQHWPVSAPPPVSTPQPRHVLPAFSLFLGSSSSTTTSSSSSSSSSKKSSDDKSKGASLFNSIKFAFPRSPRTSIISVDSSRSRDSSVSDSFVPMQTVRHPPSPPPHSASWHFRSSPKHTSPFNIPDSNCRQEARLRSGRRWFSPVKLFTSAGAS